MLDKAGIWEAMQPAARAEGGYWECDNCDRPPAKQLHTPGGLTLYFCSEPCFDQWWTEYASSVALFEMSGARVPWGKR
jgi:hypothetical protein